MKQILEDIIRTENIRTVFQPIVSLLNGDILGYEALSRGPAGSPLERPDMMFKAAEEHNMIWELEYLCRLKALEKAQNIVPSKMLFINDIFKAGNSIWSSYFYESPHQASHE